MHHAVFPRGARIRPRLTFAVAAACGEDAPTVTEAAGAAIELLHCASLVHDDLPCFDNADTRRGQPSVHTAFGEPLAVLGWGCPDRARLPDARWPSAPPPMPHPPGRPSWAPSVRPSACPAASSPGRPGNAKTPPTSRNTSAKRRARLFAAATIAGAASAGAECEPWRAVGMWLGEAFQVADDILDATASREALGKPVGQDHRARTGRAPSPGLGYTARSTGSKRARPKPPWPSVPPCMGRVRPAGPHPRRNPASAAAKSGAPCRMSESASVVDRLSRCGTGCLPGVIAPSPAPAFRRWAVAFPLTRGVARHRTRALFDLCAGFVYSQILLACVQLRLFDMLGRTRRSTPAALAPPGRPGGRTPQSACSPPLPPCACWPGAVAAATAWARSARQWSATQPSARWCCTTPCCILTCQDPVALCCNPAVVGRLWPITGRMPAPAQRPDTASATARSRPIRR